MKAIIGTAGHIDHGKTALVRALTGIDTDRLPEEQQRGISIELGFAYLELPGGERAGIVDVPGHERFIRQMLAGAQGFDLLLLTVAADDGVMPQTEEHFEICHLLGVRKAVFVITKADLATAARLEEVRSEIEILAAGTDFEDAPVVAVSAHTGDGIEGLRALVLDALQAVERPGGQGAFRMPVDRAFVLKGHGVIVTGTASAGSVTSGDEVELVPSGRSARVREIQVHDARVERAFAGQRVALNLAGVERDQVARGDSVVHAGLHSITDRFDAAVEVRPSAGKPLRSHERVRVYLGTGDVPGRIIWLDGIEAVEPRRTAYAQLALGQRTVAFAGDRFVVRDQTASRTLGGGTVLVAHAHRHRKAEGELTPRLRALEYGDIEERLVVLSDLGVALGIAPAEAALGLGMEVEAVLAAATASDALVLLPDATSATLIVGRTRYERYLDQLVARTAAFHDEHSSQSGIELERLRQEVGYRVDPRLFRQVADALVGVGRLVRRGSTVAVPQHRVSMSEADEETADRVLRVVREAAAMPPTFKQLEESLGVPARTMGAIVAVLVERDEVVKVSTDLVFAREVVSDIEGRLRAFLQHEGEITAAGFRDLISASRKYSIPLLDYFDRTGVTVRSGDYRRLREA